MSGEGGAAWWRRGEWVVREELHGEGGGERVVREGLYGREGVRCVVREELHAGGGE